MTVHDVAPRLPAPAALRRLCRSLAMLDAILCPDRNFRYHFFDAHRIPGQEAAWMSNGSGDEYTVLFSASGVCLLGFDHESPLTPYARDDLSVWPGVIDDVPETFRPFVDSAKDEWGTPAVTACMWQETRDAGWRHGAVDVPSDADDGAEYLFELLVDPTPDAFQRFAQDYYEVPVDLTAVGHLYASRPLTDDVVASLNSRLALADLADDVHAIGYPCVAPGTD